MNRITRIAHVAAVGLSLALAACSKTPDAGAPAAAAPEAAKTPAEHEAIASEYDQLATKADHLVENHKGMAEAYTSGPAASKYATMTTHCQQIIDSYTKAAKEYRAMAAEHRALAKGQ